MNPEKGDGWRSIDGLRAHVPRSAGDDAPDDETQNDTGVPHEWTAEELGLADRQKKVSLESSRLGVWSKRLTRMMVAKLAKPRPAIRGDPQGAGLGAEISGQSAKNPSGPPLQFVPPPQFRIPDLPMSEVPIRLSRGAGCERQRNGRRSRSGSHNSRPGDDGREDLLELTRRHKRQTHLPQRA